MGKFCECVLSSPTEGVASEQSVRLKEHKFRSIIANQENKMRFTLALLLFATACATGERGELN